MKNLPSDFEQLMIQDLGKEEYELLAKAICDESPTSIRINTDKVEKEEIQALKDAEPVGWCKTGYYLSERPHFTFDPLLHSGCYYVQEASSMFLHHILRHYLAESGPITALDLCAAPGGKSTLALSALPKDSLLIANEPIRQRANILAENITKWGNPNCIVTNNYAPDFQPFGSIFDVIICDAPCSGEGMFRKDPASIDEWSLANVETCWKRQREIVQDIWHTLKDEGLFIYSTCTYNSLEDEQNVQWIADTLGAEILSCHPLTEWNLPDKNIHFYPHKTKGEGFFISVLRKHGEEENPSFKKAKKKDGKQTKAVVKIPKELSNWILSSEDFRIYEENETFRAFPSSYYKILEQAKQTLKIVHSGINLATMKGKNLQPCHSLALSTHLNKETFPVAEVDYNQAIAYLRTEALQLPAGTPTGYVIITYQGHPLGFAKNIGNRANNLYPSEWKIKSTYVPQNQ